MTGHTTGEEHWPGQGQLNQAAKMHYQRGLREAWAMVRKCEYVRCGSKELLCANPANDRLDCTYSTCPLLKEKP